MEFVVPEFPMIDELGFIGARIFLMVRIDDGGRKTKVTWSMTEIDKRRLMSILRLNLLDYLVCA